MYRSYDMPSVNRLICDVSIGGTYHVIHPTSQKLPCFSETMVNDRMYALGW